jgi:hypothetical protein
MSGKRSVETTAAQVTAELLQPGFGPGKRVTIIFESALSPARLSDRARENPTVLPPYKISALVRPCRLARVVQRPLSGAWRDQADRTYTRGHLEKPGTSRAFVLPDKSDRAL